MRRSLLLLLMAVGITAFAHAAEKALPQTIDFNRDIRPIFSENCYFCHGPDKNKRKGDLRLDTKDGLFSTHDAAPNVAPGHVEQSELYRRITTANADERMPDPKSNKKLADRQIALIKLWIEQGAPWKGHWAYLPVVRPPVPQGTSENPIDSFVLAGLKDAGLHPAPQADRVTLIRRLSFDLTGLAPTEAEVRQFVHDDTPDAYDRLVDRLMSSPHFGERMAMWWLDLVRYADSIGYHSDNPMNVWPYRDYVIRAFNQDKPFDQFTREQIAGDLLPDATQETRVASCYNRLIETTEEGGAQPKEYAVKYECDRVRNVSNVWMAATMGCCQCHDHKFDPYTQKDFYNMAAFFADVQEAAVGRREPGMPVLDNAQAKELKALDSGIAELGKTLNQSTPSLAAAQLEWEQRQQRVNRNINWTVLTVDRVSSRNGAAFQIKPDRSVLASKTSSQEVFTVTATTHLHGITGIRLEALPDPSFPSGGPGAAPNGNFILTGFSASVNGSPVALVRAAADHSQSGYAIENVLKNRKVGWAILPETGKPHAAVFEPEIPIAGGGQEQLSFTLDFQSTRDNVLGHFRLAVTTDSDPARQYSVPANIRKVLAVAADQRDPDQKNELARYYRSIAPSLGPLRDQLAETKKDKESFLAQVPKCLVSASTEPRVVRLLHRGDWMDDSGDVESPAVPHFLPQPRLSMREGEAPADPHVCRDTGFQPVLTTSEVKEPAIAASLSPHGARHGLKTRVTGNAVSGGFASAGFAPSQTQAHQKRLTRLDLANWLVSRENPLTARVVVNRLWKLYFGIGISKSLDDLGSQGESPTNPELLDWLAGEFMDSGWDMKHMVRLMVTSATYRQSSAATSEDKQIDPFNRLYSHQARFRLDAEVIRDEALQFSGLLSPKIGGPSVRPYQPGGFWDPLNFPPRKYEADAGESQYRRGLYTWWQRTFPHPSQTAFDQPTREEAACERLRSNIPQQALVLLNDPTYVEAARVFAARIMKEGGTEFSDRLKWAFQTALNRDPTPAESRIISDLYQKHLQEYSQDKDDAKRFASTGQAAVPNDLDVSELAAWTSVARVIINLSETITRS
ncbi:MAG TPA: PSD1 and planctomycete cytochrome C domain-containing protein [Tepidisphaeraceae bacterium]|nr:PSD1 and planctomycete cytochrome C domain-containing protein [Tepidisphaeraceae bacterium]